MCGIHAVISVTLEDTEANSVEHLSSELRRRLCNRGPDYIGQVVTEWHPEEGGFRPGQLARQKVKLCFTSTVLALRGDSITPQPFVSGEAAGPASVLCWNGEAWKLQGSEVGGNDGQTVFNLLNGLSAVGSEDRRDAILDALRSIEGPFAFVYFDQLSGRVYFGRDRLGRRSLLMRRGSNAGQQNGQLILSSVSDTADSEWAEVEGDGIYVADLAQAAVFGTEASASLHAGNNAIICYSWINAHAEEASIVSGIGHFNMSTEAPLGQSILTADAFSVRGLHDQLVASLRLRILNVPKPPLLYGLAKAQVDSSRDARIAVLFSGGLDCTVLARMSHDLLPPEQGIDLINVAFENPRVAAHHGADVIDVYEACPDRITGRKSFAELQHVCPRRAWRFIAVNVPYEEIVAHRPEIISLMHPHKTEMDLSIASALYFAARSIWLWSDGDDDADKINATECASPARVLLSGLGADELFGGYGRHGIAFARKGYAGLADELLLDVARLGQRNLGRDDRVMAHWGKEVRFPFLDEELVKWAIGLPAWEKCDFANPADATGECSVEPAKRVLRLVAQSLGMTGVALEKKRAIQFGARTAKMESGRVKGTALVS